MPRFYAIIIQLLVTSTLLQAQSDSIPVLKRPTDSLRTELSVDTTAFKTEININAGIIVNRAYCNFSTDNSLFKDGSAKISASGNPVEVFTGGNFGAEAFLGESSRLMFFIGASGCYSYAKYKYTENITVGYGKTYEWLENYTVYDVNVASFMVNYESGAKIKLFKGFYIRNSFLVNQNISRAERRTGKVVKTQWSTNPNPGVANYNIQTSENIDYTSTNYSSVLNFSYRIALEYNFRFKNKKAGVFAFRNFGITTDLPWWGLGLNIYLKE